MGEALGCFVGADDELSDGSPVGSSVDVSMVDRLATLSELAKGRSSKEMR